MADNKKNSYFHDILSFYFIYLLKILLFFGIYLSIYLFFVSYYETKNLYCDKSYLFLCTII